MNRNQTMERDEHILELNNELKSLNSKIEDLVDDKNNM